MSTIVWYGGSVTSYAEINGVADANATSYAYSDEGKTLRLPSLVDENSNPVDHVTTQANGHYKFGVVDGDGGPVYLDFGNGVFIDQPRDIASRLKLVEATTAQVVPLAARVTVIEQQQYLPVSAVGTTITPLNPTTLKVPDNYINAQSQWTSTDLGPVTGLVTVDVSKYNDITLQLIGDVQLAFLAVDKPDHKGEWTVRPAQDSVGGHVLDCVTVNRWEGAGTGVSKATALAISTGPNSESELGFVSRDGGLVAQTALYCKTNMRATTSLDAAILALSPYDYYRLNETTGTVLADAVGGAPGAVAGTGLLLAQPASTPSDLTGKGILTGRTGYATLDGAVGNLTTGFTVAVPLHADNIGADWVSTGSISGLGLYTEGKSGDTAHNQACLMVSVGKYRSSRVRVLLRVVKGGVPVDIIGTEDNHNGTIADGRDRYAILRGTLVDSTHFKVDMFIDGAVTDTWTFDPTGCTFNPNLASLGAFVRGDVQTGHWARFDKVGRWTRPLTDAQIATLVATWRGSRINGKRKWSSGAFVNNGSKTALEAFGAMRGRPMDRVLIFNSATTWGDIESIANIDASYRVPEYQYANSNRIYYSAVGLPFGDSSQTLTQGAAGAYDFHWTNLANNLKNAGFTNPHIRPLEEPDLTSGYWPHGIANGSNAARNFAGGLSQGQVMANYRTYFQRIVAAMRAVLPGATFHFCPQLIAYGWERYYPGDLSVDVYDPDVYDIDWEQNILPAVESSTTRLKKIFSGNGNNGMLFANRFILPGASRLDDSPGVGVLTTATKRLKFGFTEWGLANPEWGSATSGKGGGGGDDPDFIDWLWETLLSVGVNDTSYVDNDMYFEYGQGGAGTYGPRHWIAPHTTDDKPNARARYQYWMNA